MLDHFTIFTKGGFVLWEYNQGKLRSSPVDSLIRSVLLEERSGENAYNFDLYTIKWTFANEFELIFVAVYQKILSLLYIDDLLAIVREKFCEMFGDKIQNFSHCEFEFTEMFETILRSLEMRKSRSKQPRRFSETEKGKKVLKENSNKGKKKEKKPKPVQEEDHSEEEDNSKEKEEMSSEVPNEEATPSSEENEKETQESSNEIQENIAKLKKKMNQGRGKAPKSKPTSTSNNPKRGNREWDLKDGKVSKKDLEKYDYSKKVDSSPTSTKDAKPLQVGTIDLDNWKEKASSESSKSGFMSFFGNLTGSKALESSDLQPVMDKFKSHLISKNVASEIADKLCESVSTSLIGKKLGTFTRVKTAVREALEDALKRILTPKRNIDILREVLNTKQEGRPYIITFCGVNGVGKSTNLAKISSWLMQNGYKVMLTACDTFRSGAVEQLNVHAQRLGVELFERGYRTDPTLIALEAVRYAKTKGIDVVMIDTAGRMQNNAPLMQALSKLVNTVKPDLILFVGEALVGNDGVDQLKEFNQSLMDLSQESNPRLIDGIILSKFDTIDDKVGAAISMVYTTGQPIVFLGTGQSYSDLKRMNVNVVINALLQGA